MKTFLMALPLGVIMASCGGSQSAPPPFKAVADTKTLMLSLVEKQAGIVWESVSTTLVDDQVIEKRPTTEEQWNHVRDAAVTVTEAGNLLMIAPRAQDEEWMKAAAAMIVQGERLLNAIDRRNSQEVFDVGSDLYEVCVNCHMYYMPAIKEFYTRDRR